MPQSELIISPVGRWINGSMTELVKTDYQNRPIDPDKYRYSVGIAFRKDDPATGEMLQKMAAHAYQEFSVAPHIQQLIGQYNFKSDSGFSWKVKDGDLPNLKGLINKNSVGHYVIYFSSEFITKCADQTNAEISNDHAVMTCGNFIQVAFTVAGNGKTDKTAGIYVNPRIYRFVAYGEPIVGGVDAATAFAGHDIPQQLPAGASLTPVATQMAVPAGVQQSGVVGPQPTAQGLQQVTPTAPLNTLSTTGYLGNPGTPGVQGVTPPQPGVPGVTPPQPGVPGVPSVTPHPTFANGPSSQQSAPSVPGLPPR